MKSSISSGVMLTLLFTGILFLGFNIQPVKASGTIFVRADGSVDPSTANITSLDNVTYVFTGNNYDEIVVERSNITIDGNSYAVQGSGGGCGFNLTNVCNVTIKNTNIKSVYYGVYLSGSSYNSIVGNDITANGDYGIYLSVSSNNRLSGNNVTNSSHGIGLYESSNNTITGNIATASEEMGIQLGLYANYNIISGNNITNNWHGIGLEDSSNNTIFGNSIVMNLAGISLDKSLNNTISRNNVTMNIDGIFVARSSGNRIHGNNVKNNGNEGISLTGSSNNSISENDVTDNNYMGIFLYDCSGNTVSGNNVTKSDYGIHPYDSSNNTLAENNVTNNGIGIYLYRSPNNFLRDNVMIGNFNNFGVRGETLSHFVNDVDTSNTVDEKSVHYCVGRHNTEVPEEAGYIALVNCALIRIKNLTLTRNLQGILLANTVNSTIAGNTLANNDEGIVLHFSSNNHIYHNNFINNTYQTIIYPEHENTWDDGYPSGGNYWSNYTGVDANSDGIGDTPYVISENNQDRYPLIDPYGSDLTPPTTLHDYDGLWQTTDFNIILTATDDANGVAETYYKINDGSTKTISSDGQPLVTTESANNTLEYWSVDNSDNEELPHKIVKEIKLDKTVPTIGIPSRTPDSDVQPYQSVKVSVNITDATSQIKNVQLHYNLNNEDPWFTLVMNYNSSTGLYELLIPGQPNGAWVKYKITAYDNAGNNATLDGTEPHCTYQVIPEFSSFLILSLFIIATVATVVYIKKRKKQ